MPHVDEERCISAMVYSMLRGNHCVCEPKPTEDFESKKAAERRMAWQTGQKESRAPGTQH